METVNAQTTRDHAKNENPHPHTITMPDVCYCKKKKSRKYLAHKLSRRLLFIDNYTVLKSSQLVTIWLKISGTRV